MTDDTTSDEDHGYVHGANNAASADSLTGDELEAWEDTICT